MTEGGSHYENGIEKLILAVKTDQVGSGVAWIFPVPATPDRVNINVFDSFPDFEGIDAIQMAKYKTHTWDVPVIASLTQMYTFPIVIGFLFVSGSKGLSMSSNGVQVYEHIEKKGLVTEIVSAKSVEGLQTHLSSYGVKVTDLHTIEDYIGKDYSFVVSWADNIGSGQAPAVYVEFPTDKIFFPLKPSSIYGSRGIPVILYVIGFVKPVTYSSIENYTSIRYFSGILNSSDSMFHKNGSIIYTRIVIGPRSDIFNQVENVVSYGYGSVNIDELMKRNGEFVMPASYFTDDLWIDNSGTAEANKAKMIIDINNFTTNNFLLFLVVWLITVSFVASSVASLLVFRNFSFAKYGIANCLTIIGLYFVLKADKIEKTRKFIAVFSAIFILVNFILFPFILGII
ncbi:MAG: hypothetical protein V1870_00680 [Candidatus Aenigmatarchaeota archaeon]